MQEPNQDPVEQKPAPSSQGNMTEPTRRALDVKFVVQSPQTMPLDRLKARAELVRNALNCGIY